LAFGLVPRLSGTGDCLLEVGPTVERPPRVDLRQLARSSQRIEAVVRVKQHRNWRSLAPRSANSCRWLTAALPSSAKLVKAVQSAVERW